MAEHEYNDVLLAWAGDEDAQSRVGTPVFRTYSMDPETGQDSHIIYGFLLDDVLSIHVHVRRAPANQRITLTVVRPDNPLAPTLSEVNSGESVESKTCPRTNHPRGRHWCSEAGGWAESRKSVEPTN